MQIAIRIDQLESSRSKHDVISTPGIG